MLGSYTTIYVLPYTTISVRAPIGPSSCDPLCGFQQTDQGCFFVDNNLFKNWTDVEAACQAYGSDVHLATLGTQQVGAYMLYHS